MKTIKITKNVNRQLLAEQLFAAFPSWRYLNPFDGTFKTDVVITNDLVMFPDATDENAVQAVIDAHDPNGLSINEQERLKEQTASEEFDGMPDWLKNATYVSVEQAIQDRTVGDTTRQQALDAVDAAANLADLKAILRKIVIAIYGLVDVNQKIARVILALVFFVRRRRW